jgi:hypothetical protein
MNDIQKRFVMFLVGCIGMRLFFVYIAKMTNPNYLPYLGLLAILPAVGFTYIYLTDSRKTGLEVIGGKIWWNKLRPIHALFYALFAYYAINKSKIAWVFLLIDVVFGLLSFLIYHYLQGNYSKLF